MKIICAKKDLQKSINIALRSVPVHTTMPILECIMINAENGRIRFTTNDTELGIETIVPGLIEEIGSVAINAKMFSDMIRKLPEEDVIVQVDENMGVRIICGKSEQRLGGMSGSDFMYLPDVEKEECITVSQFTLKEIIRQTIFSIAPNDNNKIMTGELFKVQGDTLQVVSLDGHRISLRNTQLKENYADKRVIVPGKSLIEISKILDDAIDKDVNIFLAENYIVFEMEDTTIVSRLIDGEYFRIEGMLSNDYETRIRVNRRDFLAAIDRSTIFIKENDKKPIIFDVRDGHMELSIESTIGSMKEDLDIDKEGKDILIGFNPKFLIDALRVIDEEIVTLYLVNPKAPCFIRDDNGSYMYIVLPVNFVR